MGWLKYAACLAFGLWAAPAVRQVEKLSLDDITAWAGNGPLADSGAPFMGVYYFHGMSGVLLGDLTYCTSWDSTTRILRCTFYDKTTIFPDGSISRAERALDTSPTPPLSGIGAFRLFSFLHYAVDFHFNEQLTKATVVARPMLFSFIQRLFFEETLEKVASKEFTAGPWFKSEKDISLSGAWVRNNYAPPTASEPSTGYALLPVLTKKGGLNKANLARAKAKNPNGDVVIRVK